MQDCAFTSLCTSCSFLERGATELWTRFTGLGVLESFCGSGSAVG